jgi:hypothetical protein
MRGMESAFPEGQFAIRQGICNDMKILETQRGQDRGNAKSQEVVERDGAEALP